MASTSAIKLAKLESMFNDLLEGYLRQLIVMVPRHAKEIDHELDAIYIAKKLCASEPAKRFYTKNVPHLAAIQAKCPSYFQKMSPDGDTAMYESYMEMSRNDQQKAWALLNQLTAMSVRIHQMEAQINELAGL